MGISADYGSQILPWALLSKARPSRIQAGDIDAAPYVWNSIRCHDDRGVTGAFIGSIGSTGPCPGQARSRQTGGAGTGWADRDCTGDPAAAGCHSP